MSVALGQVRDAVAAVCDPEYPDVSIDDLGLVECVELDDRGVARVGLVPTFGGCPALEMIAADVRSSVEAVEGVTRCDVDWLTSPAWSSERITDAARERLAGEYTVVLRPRVGSLRCPVCGSDRIDDRGEPGPTRCRTVAWCRTCRNVVEVVR